MGDQNSAAVARASCYWIAVGTAKYRDKVGLAFMTTSTEERTDTLR